ARIGSSEDQAVANTGQAVDDRLTKERSRTTPGIAAVNRAKNFPAICPAKHNPVPRIRQSLDAHAAALWAEVGPGCAIVRVLVYRVGGCDNDVIAKINEAAYTSVVL